MGSSTPKSGKKEKKEKKDKKEKRERREDANTDADEAKKQKVRDETESDGGTPTRVRVVGLTKSANAGSLSGFLGLDAAEVVVGMWGTHGKGPKPPGGQAFASVKSRRAAESLVAAYDGKTLDGVELKVIVDDGDVVVAANGGMTPGKESGEAAARPPLFGGGGAAATATNSTAANTTSMTMVSSHEVRADDWTCGACLLYTSPSPRD